MVLKCPLGKYKDPLSFSVKEVLFFSWNLYFTNLPGKLKNFVKAIKKSVLTLVLE